ncbi:dihydropyrimidinase [Acuticoccus mangrovi]|uniref:Dihydropyrimidinase n=1 Tax=Acuticoccus mangrovi TaxID=2796142 RepID=A0A934ME21_9HYPH|nr:dihydropyrimidinase [Acuticoccus mangrovi]
MTDYDLVIRGGTVATASDVFAADVAVSGGTIAAIGSGLGRGRTEIDARGRFVLPGGVDSHTHIEQMSSGGFVCSDTFETATKAALMGGTTTTISFVAQGRGESVARNADAYHALARAGAVTDYAFHLILADPTEEVLKGELPELVAAGHSSLKLFMTYDRVKLDDLQILDVLETARELGALVMAHAENHGMIEWLTRRLLDRGYTHARYHGVAHARAAEAEAFQRLIALAELVDQPVMLYHVSTAEGAAIVRQARGRGLKVYAETCPQYLFLTRGDMDRPGNEAAKFVYSPPGREAADGDALWAALAQGDLQLISSDHSPYAFDDTGKLRFSPTPNFKEIVSGMPGIEARLPLLFDAMVASGRFRLTDFVRWTASEPARLYGLAPQKGTIAPGADADIAIWDADKEITFADESVHDGARYTPYAGRTVRGWPVTTVRRGEVVVDDGRLLAAAGSGRFLARAAGEAAMPLGRPSPEFDPARNFGAVLR